MAITVLDLSLIRMLRLSWMCFSVSESRDEVASSRISILVSLRIALAMAILCL